jgi:two-component system chemotaxis response regulator CheY
MKCLVVDDSATMRRIVANALKAIGYADVVEAGDGKEALAKMDSTIEMVITDWNMPNMGGLDLVKHLRGNPKTAKTPILMVTTRSVKEDILEALEAGVNSYILKPFTPQVLKEKLDQVSALASGSA